MAQPWGGPKLEDEAEPGAAGAFGNAWPPTDAPRMAPGLPGYSMAVRPGPAHLQSFAPEQMPQMYPAMVDYHQGPLLAQYGLGSFSYYNAGPYGQEPPKNMSSQGFFPAPAPVFQPPPLPYFGQVPVPYPPMPYQPVHPTGAGFPLQSDLHSESLSGRTQNNPNGFKTNNRGWKQFNNANGNNRHQRPRHNSRSFGGPGMRSGIPLRCESCDRNFVGRAQMEAHFKTHVKCAIGDCTFQAIGTVVNEHRSQAHMKLTQPPKPLSKEQVEEIQKWREARKRNYPTTENIGRKLQKIQDRRDCGELVDEEAIKRQESLKQILAKQKELGCPVAEVPTYYLSRAYTEGGLKRSWSQVDEEREDGEITMNEQQNGGFKNRARKPCQFFQQGRCKKGRRCTFLHDFNSRRKNFNKQNASNGTYQQQQQQQQQQRGQERQGRVEQARKPSLLAKLLQTEIQRDKSYLLQCFRFFVNNNFLLDDKAPLKFFEWSNDEASAPAAAVPALDLLDGEEDDEGSCSSEEEEGELDEADGTNSGR